MDRDWIGFTEAVERSGFSEAQIRELMEQVRLRVRQGSGVELESEVRFIGREEG